MKQRHDVIFAQISPATSILFTRLSAGELNQNVQNILLDCHTVWIINHQCMESVESTESI